MIFKLKACGLAGILIFLSSSVYTEVLRNDDMKCPDSPNCVSSTIDNNSNHYIKPYTFTGSPDEAMARLKTALLNEKRVTIITSEPDILRAEVRSLIFHYVDDVEFKLMSAQNLIHVRSSSRTGYYDIGVNRRRIERIRKFFQSQENK